MTSEPQDRILTVTWNAPRPEAALMHRLSGLEYLRSMFPPPPGIEKAAPIGRLLQIYPTEFKLGFAAFEAIPAEQHYNLMGSVHGGFAATLLDSAIGCAVHSGLEAGRSYTTLDLRVSYVKAIRTGSGPLRCEARTLSIGARIATAEGRITDRDGRLCAHGSATCLVFDLPPKQ
ncbi:MAG: PaaI family thioesterase [Afipia sp.]